MLPNIIGKKKRKAEPIINSILLTEELPNSLRTLPVKTNLLKDRVNSMQQRNKMFVSATKIKKPYKKKMKFMERISDRMPSV